MKAQLLLIEDDPSTGSALQKVLRAEGYGVDLVARGDQGLVKATEGSYDLVLTDFKLPGLGGLELIQRLHQAKPKLPIIMMTAHGTTETAIEATKLGAYEYLTKPCEADELLALVDTAVAGARLMSEPVQIGESTARGNAIVGSSRAMQVLYKEIGRIATATVTVLIRGATGTGKELIARAIYQHSNRADHPFVAVNCAAIPQNLLESELFGHERGSFSGAVNRRIGRFEQANGGTIFLDEIGDLPADTQAKLLRVLQEKYIQRVGGDAVIPVDVRVLAATHRDLESAIAEREFRQDLYFRLSVVTLNLPTLSERTEDIPALIHYFMQRHAADLGITEPAIQPDATAFLQSQPWPGNVRELENVVRQAMLAARPFAITIDQIKLVTARSRPPSAIREQTHLTYIAELIAQAERGEVENIHQKMVQDLEAELFTQAIRVAGGNQAKAARWLGVTRLKMREKLTELGLRAARD